MKNYIYILLLVLPMLCFAQLNPNQPEQDCNNAVVVCSGFYNQPNSYQGSGLNPNEIPFTSCLASGERASVWYTFTAQTSGRFSFSITPTDLGDDYDWALFNTSINGCTGIPAGTSPEVSCNYSGQPGITGANGLAGFQNEPTFPVTAGQSFSLNVSNFSQTGSGYALNFNVAGAGGAVIFDSNPPQIQSVSSTTVGASVVNVLLTENVPCGNVRPSDFVLLDPDGITIPINGITTANCSSGGRFDNLFNLSLARGLTKCGQYTLQLTGSIVDECNNRSSVTSVNFTPANLPTVAVNIVSQSTSCDSVAGANGIAELVITPPQSNAEIEWSHLYQTTYRAIQLPPGNHSVRTFLFGRSCSITTNFTIQNTPVQVGLNVQVIPNTLCPSTRLQDSVYGNGQAIIVSNDSNLGNYTWAWKYLSQIDAPMLENLPPITNTYLIIQHRSLNCLDTIFFDVPDTHKQLDIEVVVTDAHCGIKNGEAHLNVIFAGSPAYKIFWDASRTDINYITGLDTGNHLLYIKDQLNCYDSVAFLIVDSSLYTIDVDTFPDTCIAGKGSIVLNMKSAWQQAYQHYWNPNPDSTNTADSLSVGQYNVITINKWGCTSFDTIYVPPLTDTPTAGFSFRDSIYIINPEVAFEDSSKNRLQWFWDFDDNFFSTDSTPTHSYTYPGNYNVTQIVTDQWGCQDTITHLVVINFYPTLYLPNAFTPNGDAFNEEFKPKYTDIDPSDYLLRIFDRSGNQVFYSTDPTKGWNGKLDNTGKFVQADVYNYEVFYKGLNGFYDKQLGHVSIVR